MSLFTFVCLVRFCFLFVFVCLFVCLFGFFFAFNMIYLRNIFKDIPIIYIHIEFLFTVFTSFRISLSLMHIYDAYILMLNVLHLLVRFGAPQIFHLFVCFDFSLLLVLLGMCLFLFFNHYYSHLYFS